MEQREIGRILQTSKSNLGRLIKKNSIENEKHLEGISVPSE